MSKYGRNIFAIDEHGNKIHVKDVPDGIIERHAHVYRCPDCNEIMIAKKGEVSAHHFAHKPGSICRGRSSAADWRGEWLSYFTTDEKKSRSFSGPDGHKIKADYVDNENSLIIQFKSGFTKLSRFSDVTDALRENADNVAWVFDASSNGNLKLWNGKPLSGKLAKCKEGDVFSIKWPVSRPVLRYWDSNEKVAGKDPGMFVYFHVSGLPGHGWVFEMIGRDYGNITVRAMKASSFASAVRSGKLTDKSNTGKVTIKRAGVTSVKEARIGATVELPAVDARKVKNGRGLRWKASPGGYVYGAEKACQITVKEKTQKYILEEYEIRNCAEPAEKIRIPKVVLGRTCRSRKFAMGR